MAVVSRALVGRAFDGGIQDANNMGAAMAPAAADSILRYFTLTHESADDYDLILTGDLGYEGTSMEWL